MNDKERGVLLAAYIIQLKIDGKFPQDPDPSVVGIELFKQIMDDMGMASDIIKENKDDDGHTT